jgi:hypothetical protein
LVRDPFVIPTRASAAWRPIQSAAAASSTAVRWTGRPSAAGAKSARGAENRPGIVFGAFGEEPDRGAIVELGIESREPSLDNPRMVALAERQRNSVRPAKP